MSWLDTLADIVEIATGIAEILVAIISIVKKPHNDAGNS